MAAAIDQKLNNPVEMNILEAGNPEILTVYFDPNILYCTCQMPETAEMIGCDECEKWYHCTCVGADFNELMIATATGQEYPFECEECRIKKNPKLAKSKATAAGAKTALVQTKAKADEVNKKGKHRVLD